MIWQSAWAWAGLLTVSVPVLIHLLGRDQAPRHSFPTLRFLEIAELPPTRRTHLHDLLLLAIRVGILVAAVAALAQPLVLVAGRTQSLDDRLARAIVVDTSASMSRLASANERAVDAARREARRLAAEARTSVTVETSTPARAIGGAAAWLAVQPSRRELVVVSDFQAESIDGSDFAAVPRAVGIRTVQIAVGATEQAIQRQLRAGVLQFTARIDASGDATGVAWSASPAGDTTGTLRGDRALTTDSQDLAGIDAATTAAQSIGVELPLDTNILIRIVYPDAADRVDLSRRSHAISSPQLIGLIARLRSDSLLRGADSSSSSKGHGAPRDAIVVASNAVAAQDSVSGHLRLLLFSGDDAGSLPSAALIAAARRALSIATPIAEADPAMIPSTTVASWQRLPSQTHSRDTVDPATGPSDGRWLWAMVLALLGAEAWVRRARRVAVARTEERIDDRAA